MAYPASFVSVELCVFGSRWCGGGATSPIGLPVLVVDGASVLQEPVPAETAAGPGSTGTAGRRRLPGSPTSTSATTRGSAPTCSAVSAPASSPVLPGVREQHHHAGQHLQLRQAQAVHRRSESRRGRLRHPVVRLIGVQPVLPPVSPHPSQALQQGHYAHLQQGRECGVSELSVLPTSSSALPQPH